MICNRLLLLFVLAHLLVGQVACGVSLAPSWDPPEIINDVTGTGTRGERMAGQDRWLRFDPFGLPGVSIPNANTEFGAIYSQRLPAAGWTPAGLITGAATHTTFHYDENGLPEVAHLDFEDEELMFSTVNLSFLDFTADVAADAGEEPEVDRINSGVSIANDPQGRAAIAFVANPSFFPRRVNFLFDVNNDGIFNDTLSPFVSRVGEHTVRPSLAFDPQGRPYIGTIASSQLPASPGPVEVFVRNTPTIFGSSVPDPTVNSTFVSLAINPDSGFPAVAYNDLDGRALKYAEWDGDNWNAETVDSQSFLTSAENMPLSLAFDPNDGRPAIAYTHDAAVGIIGQPPPVDRLKFAWHDGSGWQTQMVDNRPGVAGGALALAFNDAPDGFGDGLPAIAYIADDDVVRYVRDPVSTILPGDFDLDGDVDADDLTVWRHNHGATGSDPWNLGDGDGDGDTDGADYLVWQQYSMSFANLGGPLPAPSTVPEPSTAVLTLVGLGLASGRRR